jgi:hypothetical protein
VGELVKLPAVTRKVQTVEAKATAETNEVRLLWGTRKGGPVEWKMSPTTARFWADAFNALADTAESTEG